MKLVDSALRTGEFESVISWDQTDLRGDLSFPAAPLLDQPRGFGYWSWKPHIILDALSRIPDGDVVVYCDAGRYLGGSKISRSVIPLVTFAEHHGGVLPGVAVPHFGPNSRWTRRDCFVLMDCDLPQYWAHPQVQTSFSFWVKCPSALAFLKEWRDFCADRRIVGDGVNACGLPNLPGYIDHRHDQSILTNLVVKHGLEPFWIRDRLYSWLVSRTPNSLAANVFSKRIDNISAVAAGASPPGLYLRALLASRISRAGREERRRRE